MHRKMWKCQKEKIIIHVPVAKDHNKCCLLDYFFPFSAFIFPCCGHTDLKFSIPQEHFQVLLKL